MAALFVYMTAAHAQEAETIGKMLVRDRLAACVNVLGPIRSFYRWDGEVQDDAEVAFIAKTEEDRLEALTEAVKKVHSYDEPCVVAMPMVGGSPSFLDWIHAETR